MATVADLLVKIGADTSDLKKELNATKRQLNTVFGSQGMAISSKALTALAGLGASIAAIGTASVVAASKLQTVQTVYENLLGSAEKGNALVADLQKFAATTTIDFTTASTAAKKFLSFGYTAEQIIPTLTAVADAAAGVGLSTEGVNKVTTALAQMGSKVKVETKEMTAITKAGVPAWQILADTMGITVAEAMEKVSSGAIDASDGVAALVTGMENKFAGSMAKQAATLEGAWSTLTTGAEQALGRVGLELADALNISGFLQGIGDTLVDFGQVVAKSGISEALRTVIPPEFQVAAVAIGTTLVGVAIPAIALFVTQISLMAAPFIAAVSAAAPFIAAAAAIASGLYLLWEEGVGVSDVLDLLGVDMEGINKLFAAGKEFIQSLGKAFSAFLTAAQPVITIIGVAAVGAFTGLMKIIGTAINLLASAATAVLNAASLIADGLAEFYDTISGVFESIGRILGDFADSLLPDWAKSGISTISGFVGQAVSWLEKLIGKITDTNEALAETTETTEKKKFETPDYSNLKKARTTSSTSGGVSGGSGNELLTAAQNADKSISDEWNRTFTTKTAQVEKWYTDELAILEKSKTANANYELDKQRLTELYAQKRLTARQEEARQEQELLDSVKNASYSHQQATLSLYDSEGEKQVAQMQMDYEQAITAIEKRWQDMATKYLGLTDTEKETYLKALDEMGLAYSVTAAGELDFTETINQEKIAKLKDYYKQAEQMEREHQATKADIQQAYNDLNMQNLQTLLTQEYALEESQNKAKLELMQTYEEAFMQAHMSTLELISEAASEALSGLETAFTDILTGAESAKDAFEALGKSMIKVIANYFSQMAAGMIMAAVLGQQKDTESAATTAANAAMAEAAWSPPAWLKLVVDPSAAGVATGLLTAGVSSAAALGSAAGALTGAVSGGVKGYASGGLFTRPMLGVLGDGPEDEVALPLNRSVFQNIANGIAGEGDGASGGAAVSAVQNIYGDINNAADLEDIWAGFTDTIAAGVKGY